MTLDISPWSAVRCAMASAVIVGSLRSDASVSLSLSATQPSAEGSSTSSAGRSAAAPGSLDLGPLTLIVACA